MKILIKNARLIDPANNLDKIGDILIEDGKISKIEASLNVVADKIIDAKDKIVMPGIVDMHVHLRQPGREDKETILSGTAAAIKGGVTSLLAMPNTSVCIDNVKAVRLLKEIIANTAKANVFICSAITYGREGKELVDLKALKKEGIVAISDDGYSVDNPAIMLKALKKAKKLKLVVTCHCEDKSISKDGVMNLGYMSTVLGLRGMPKEAEYLRVKRDIELAKKIDAPIHIAHVSCKESIEIIAKAKKEGLPVTCETAPHYFSLTEEDVRGYDTNKKMNPPLRTKEDVYVIKEALKENIIDVIASDHAPHTENEKDVEFDKAEFGVIGLETILSVSLTELFFSNILDLGSLVKKLTINPAKILNIDKGTLGIGKSADVIIVSPNVSWTVKKEDFLSKAKNSAFLGRQLKGLVDYTILGGKIVYCRTTE
ncbi:MAG: dihydroorotase [Candidatus Omnitrophica bacterium]|nr:dihydroorotase [Candidatus Omnitrophota bacterium]